MSVVEIKLCSLIIRDDFGETLEKVCVLLLRKGATPSGIIAQQLGLKLTEVKKCLCALIQQNLVTFDFNKRGFVQYRAVLRNILARVRHPAYMYAARALYGEVAEMIIEELVRHGQLQLTIIVQRVYDRLTSTIKEEDASLINLFEIRDKFINLVQTQFLQRCPGLDTSEEATKSGTAAPVFREQSEEELYIVPKVEFNELNRKRKRASTDSSEQPAKKSRIDPEAVDAGIYWCINYDRFDRHLRDQTLIQAVTNKVDIRAGEIFRAILRLSEVTTDAMAPSINALSYNEIFQALPKELNLSRQLVDQYLKILVEDSIDFIHKVGDSGGGMYIINFKKSFTTLCKAHVQSFIQERYGSKSLRIYRLLLMKKQLEQKQIEEFAMVPSKEAKEILYTLFGDNLVTLTEIPKTPDHAPSRTFFLFSVDITQVARMLLERCYKSLYNLITKRNQELADNKRVLEKQTRMESIISSLVVEGIVDDTQKQEVEEMITPAERTVINKVKNYVKKMEQSEIQIDDTVFILNMYLTYSKM